MQQLTLHLHPNGGIISTIFQYANKHLPESTPKMQTLSPDENVMPPTPTAVERYFDLRPNLSFQDIADQLGGTRQGVQQAYDRAWTKMLLATGNGPVLAEIVKCGPRGSNCRYMLRRRSDAERLQPLRLGLFTYLEALRDGDAKAGRWQWLQYGIALTATLTQEDDYQDYVRFVLSGRDTDVIAKRRYPNSDKDLSGSIPCMVARWEHAIWAKHQEILKNAPKWAA